jgi:hypothetical protein
MGRKRKYFLNEHYFDEVLTEEQAYWLGFLIADGSVSKGGTLSLLLKPSDREHIAKLIAALDAEQPIVEVKGYPIVYITSRKLANGLAKHGCIPNKTFQLLTPNLPHALRRHFYRGFSDGDGCISSHIAETYGTQYRRWQFMICGGCESFLRDMKNWIGTEINRDIGSISKDDNTYRLSYQGNISVSRVVSLLYNDSNIHLTRKKVLANNLERKWNG